MTEACAEGGASGCGGDATMTTHDPLPLVDVRVLDLASGEADAISRILADLGADVLKIEPPGGSPSRVALPAVAGFSIGFALHNANKRSAVLNPDADADRRRFLELVAGADIVVDSGIPGLARAFGTSCPRLADRFERLVAMHVTDFGADGPHASWQATDPVMYALSTALSRSGPPTGMPVLPPDGIASATAAVQAAWAALTAYYHRLRCGRGDYIDFSRFEAVLQALDPPFGAMGQGALAQRSSGAWRGRPRHQDVYPIFACKDGYVRTCVMSPRQWRGMRAWLGEPVQFQDPKYDTVGARFLASQEIGALTAALFADQPMDDLVAAGRAYGVPIAPVLSCSEVLSSDHFRAVGALTGLELPSAHHLTVPVGPFVVDGRRAGLRHPAPVAGQHRPEWHSRDTAPRADGESVRRPFDGIRILDLGIIVAGGEVGRLFADMGAEVIKVESAQFPDGLRQTRAGQPMSEAIAWTNRNKYGLGLDLRQPEGADIFARLVADADMVSANFKPGTLAGLGFPYQRLRSLNPGIVLVESSAFGDQGPWSVQLGYGPLVRAATGITRLWTSDDVDDGRPSFMDAVTVFPDHVAARVSAIAALAALVRRHHTGRGAHVHISQAEVAVNQLDVTYVSHQARAAGLPVRDNPSWHGVFPCAGNDEWCVIGIRDDRDWRALAAVIGRSALDRNSCDVSAEITRWTRTLDNKTVTKLLQQAGVPAGPMNRASDVLVDPQVQHRKLFSAMVHPLFEGPLPTESWPAPYRNIPAAELRPAPMLGEHTREICQKLIGLDDAEIDRLINAGVLFAQT
ncbi:putative CoA-transferase [Mycobacterium xenopi]|uniref:CoA-transferase n=2 Tax=Mycobacterium xenopi TaxID=1789 RepID=A0AAD1M3H9_MYCXE|nr:putative CoA-transferase [Mycobacterium xenopi]